MTISEVHMIAKGMDGSPQIRLPENLEHLKYEPGKVDVAECIDDMKLEGVDADAVKSMGDNTWEEPHTIR